MWRAQPVSTSQFPCLYSRVTCWFMNEKLSSTVQQMAHFMGREARGRRRWRGLTRHAYQTAADCGNTSSLKQVEFCCATVIYCGRCVAPCQPWLFCCMENINKPDLLTVKPLCTLSISDRNLLFLSQKKLNSRPFQNSKITSWTLWLC